MSSKPIRDDGMRRGTKWGASPTSPIARLAANPADFNSFVHTTMA
ncbi:hypothetical protein [Mesorhizobium sp. LSJC265A00]|nr:hypothetical protein [Mesorhizobium sp. LSJC265A00]